MKVKNRKGSILVMTLMIFVVLMIFGTFILNFMVNENKMSLNHQYKTQAYYIAKSGAVAVESAIMEMSEEDLEKINEELKKGLINVQEMTIDEGKVNVVIKKNIDKLVIESIGTIAGVDNLVVKVMRVENVNKEFGLDYALFGGNSIKINGNPNINGDIGTNADSVTVPNKLKDKIKLKQNKLYPHIKFPEIPKSLNKSNATEVSSINQSVYYNKDVLFTDLNINTNGNNIDIVVNNFKISNKSKKEIIINGSGKVRIFVKGNIDFSNINDINKKGNKDNLDIIYYGVQLNLQDNLHIWANLYIEKAQINISGNAHITGSIISNTSSQINVSGNIKGIDGIIYAPSATVNWSSNGEIDNGIIGSNINISGNPKISNKGTIQLPELENLPSSNTTNYSKGYFK